MRILLSIAFVASLFVGAAATATTVDFQGCGSTTTSIGVDVSVSSSSGPCSGIPAGVTFSPPAGFDLYIAAAGQSANPTTALGLDFPQGGNLTITLDNLATAFGLDLFQNFGGGFQSGADAQFLISLFNGIVPVASYNVAVASGTGSVFGVNGISPFNGITVSQAGGFAVIDNFSFGAAAVPEPDTWAMMLLGFGAIGCAMRRRQRVVVAKAA